MRRAMLGMIIITLMLFIAACSSDESPNLGRVVPGNRYYVDTGNPDASDENLGTIDKPWKTLTKAAKKLKAGDKLTIMPGTYYEELKLRNSGELGKRIIVEGAKLGDVVISGSALVKGWKRISKNSSVWEADYNYKLRKIPAAGAVFSKYYVSSEPADLTVNGTPIFWEADKNLSPGTWTVDKKAKKIYTRLPDNSDPNKSKLEIISKNTGIAVAGSYITVRKLVIRRFASGLRIYGKNVTAENNTIEWCAYEGVKIFNSSINAVLKENIIQWNGNKGTTMGPAGSFIDNKFLFNNWKLNAPGWDGSGIKGWVNLGKIVEGNEVAYNGALGLWLDGANNIDVRDNIVHDNTNIGMENEVGHKASWTGNISYRNGVGFVNFSSSNIILRNNIFSDNKIGIQYKFSRTRGPKLTAANLRKKLDRFEKNHSKEIAYEWSKDYLTYNFPCCQFRNNLNENNILLNNGMNFIDVSREKLPDPKEQWIIYGNTFKNNILINSKANKMVAGYASFSQFQEKTKKGEKCLTFPKLDLEKLPDWARVLYKKHSKRLSYPHSILSVKNIYNDLKVKNAWCRFNNYLNPSGLLAIARICESKQLKQKKFLDPALKAYYIDYKGKTTLVLWRKHGRPADFVPVILKGIPKDATLETSWGETVPFQRKNDLISINVGTWPLYIVGANEKISEAPPFSLTMPKVLEYGKAMELTLEKPIANGTLYIDKYQGVEKCPDRITINGDKVVFPITLSEDAKDSFVEFRIAGHLNGLYAGRMIRLFTGKSAEGTARLLKEKGFTPISLTSVTNCSLDGRVPENSLMQMGKTKSLVNLPGKINLGSIPFVISQGGKAVGFNSKHVKGEARPNIIKLDLAGKKYKSLAFLQVCAWAPSKTGAPLLKYSLNYDDYLGASTFLKKDLNIMDWWFPPDETQKCILNSNTTWKAWSGDCGNGHEVSLYAYVWENPYPDRGVVSLQISTADPDKNPLVGIVAISVLEKKKK